MREGIVLTEARTVLSIPLFVRDCCSYAKGCAVEAIDASSATATFGTRSVLQTATINWKQKYVNISHWVICFLHVQVQQAGRLMNCKLNYTTFVNRKLQKYSCQTEQSNELHPAPEILLFLSPFLLVCSMWCGYLICGLGPLQCFISTCWGRERCVISSCAFETLLG